MDRRTFLAGGGALLALSPVEGLLGATARDRLKAGQIGTEHSHAAGKMEAMRRLSDHYEVVGLAGDGRDKAYDGVPRLAERELLAREDVKVVAVETSIDVATATALRAIEAGKHVHLDKPGGTDVAAFRALRFLARDRQLVVQMGYMLRHNPAFELLFKAKREGWLGDVLEVTATMGKLAGAEARKTLAGYPGAGLFELGCHLVDAALTLLGPPAKITAFSKTAGADGLADNQLAVLEYPKALVTLRSNHADPDGFARRAFEVVGTKGSLRIAPLESGKLTLTLSQKNADFDKGTHALALKLPAGRYDGEFLHLARAVRGEEPFGWSAEHDVAVLETALRAAGQLLTK
jgi:predicted dehydrogenase